LWRRQSAQQICTADNADEAAFAHHRHPLDSMHSEQVGDFGEFGFVADRDDRSRHDVTRGVLLDTQLAEEFRRQGWPSASSASHQSRRASRSVPLRPIRSPSLTMPMGAPLPSTTGTALIPYSSGSRAISWVGVSGPTATTSVVMTSRAIIRVCPCSASCSQPSA
jgi:hypothetical protein